MECGYKLRSRGKVAELGGRRLQKQVLGGALGRYFQLVM